MTQFSDMPTTFELYSFIHHLTTISRLWLFSLNFIIIFLSERYRSNPVRGFVRVQRWIALLCSNNTDSFSPHFKNGQSPVFNTNGNNSGVDDDDRDGHDGNYGNNADDAVGGDTHRRDRRT